MSLLWIQEVLCAHGAPASQQNPAGKGRGRVMEGKQEGWRGSLLAWSNTNPNQRGKCQGLFPFAFQNKD